MARTFYVWAKWDAEADVWYTAETSVDGLATEADSLERLRDRLLTMIPDLLDDAIPPDARLHIIAETDDTIPLQAAE